MTVTVMQESHVPQIAKIEQLCFNDPWSENSIASELNNRLSLWLVAVEDECVIGYVGSQTVMGETDMMNIAVAPGFRRQGIAQALVEELVAALAERKSHSLMLEVRDSNAPAKALYEKLGFMSLAGAPDTIVTPGKMR